jgi:hypothetical protein
MQIGDRRAFLKLTGATVALFAACRHPRALWMGPESFHPHPEEIRMRLLRTAILAPSPHNTQPWRVEWTAENSMKLFVDRSRLLPLTDPFARQIHISQGAFLELLEMAAGAVGWRAEIAYFPEGEYANNITEAKPVASIVLSPAPAVKMDPLFEQIAWRVTNRRTFVRNRAIPAADALALRTAVENMGSGWRYIQSVAERRAIAGICTEAMAVEVTSAERNRETAAWFRFSEHELDEKRDGLGMEQNGISGLRRWVAERFLLSRERAADTKGIFARGAIDMAREQGSTAAAFGALVSDGNSRLDQVLAGRAYLRLHLTAARAGLAMQPLSQSLEEYSGMTAQRQQLKDAMMVTASQTVQMLVRLGYAAPTPHSPRRDAACLLQRPVAS